MNKFGIVGYGIVGKATHLGLLEHAEVIKHDIILETTLDDLKECDYVFFCTPTDDQTNINSLIDEIKNLKQINPNCKIIIRSTVPLGTCDNIEKTINEKILYIPEFLRQRVWEIDCLKKPFVVGHNSDSLPQWLLEKDIVECTLKEAEILKMFNNTLNAAKVVFANHFYEISKSVGEDYKKILDTYSLVSHNQTYLEANEDMRGFGGKCLPKDLDFTIQTLKDLNLNQTYFTSIREDNTQWKTTVRKS
jgi:UDPglucose 6-dehydrogenase